jgi:hypothetical protein
VKDVACRQIVGEMRNILRKRCAQYFESFIQHKRKERHEQNERRNEDSVNRSSGKEIAV